MRLSLCLSIALVLTACGSAPRQAQPEMPGPGEPLRWGYMPDLEVSHPPFQTVHANWKQRVDQGYVFLEHTGHYHETGSLLTSVYAAMEAQDIVPSGPPFGLFYDDPGKVPTEELRSRACAPVDGPVQVSPPLAYGVLRGQTVAYALASGPYPEVPRVYPGLFEYLNKMSWVEDGPVREIYLVPPSRVADYAELVTEVQVPVRPAR